MRKGVDSKEKEKEDKRKNKIYVAEIKEPGIQLLAWEIRNLESLEKEAPTKEFNNCTQEGGEELVHESRVEYQIQHNEPIVEVSSTVQIDPVCNKTPPLELVLKAQEENLNEHDSKLKLRKCDTLNLLFKLLVKTILLNIFSHPDNFVINCLTLCIL